jgi:hypothetical protein
MIRKVSTFLLLAAVITAWAAGRAPVAAQGGHGPGHRGGGGGGAPARPDLTGEWQLNPELSEDAQEKLQSMGGGHGPGHGGGPGGHGPGHGGGGGGGAEAKQMEEVRNLLLNAPTRFLLTQDDQKVVLTEPNGHVRTLPTNNRKVTIDGRDVRTKWKKNRLVSETTVGNAKLVETYERSPSAPQLVVTARLDMDGRRVSVRRVYVHPAAAVGR